MDIPAWVAPAAAILSAVVTAFVTLSLLPSQLKKAGIERRKTAAETESATILAAKTAVETMNAVLVPLNSEIVRLTAAIISLEGTIAAQQQDIRERDRIISERDAIIGERDRTIAELQTLQANGVAASTPKLPQKVTIVNPPGSPVPVVQENP